jgi:DNA-binding SARP family transcriptional activator
MDPAAAPEGRPGNLDLDGELLPGWYDDWVLVERECLRQLRVHAFEALAGKFSAAARYGEAVEAAYAALRADPLRESAHRTVVRIHLAEGNLIEAVRAYQACRDLFADELGVTPTPEMSRLVRGLPGSVVVPGTFMARRGGVARGAEPATG